jgi:hypothetical protein
MMDDEVVQDPTCSPAFAKSRSFIDCSNTNCPNLCFVGFIDGVQPFGRQCLYSMWPITLYCLNIKPGLRIKLQYQMLYGIVCGPKSPSSLQSPLSLFVDDLLELYDPGVVVHDAMLQHDVLIRVMLSALVEDYPACSKSKFVAHFLIACDQAQSCVA